MKMLVPKAVSLLLLAHWISSLVNDIAAAQALSWPGRNAGRLVTPVGNADGQEKDDLSKEPIATGLRRYAMEGKYVGDEESLSLDSTMDSLLFDIRSFDMRSKRSDCFRRASRLARENCLDHDIDEEERVRVAISMTLCELATAQHYSAPQECTRFSPDVDEQDTDNAVTARCVEALSRSAQHWSSYSGYMREIPQLCTTFQRWHDVDIAKATYRNATIENAALLKLFTEEENRSLANIQTWESHLQLFKVAVADLQKTELSLEHRKEEMTAAIHTSVANFFEEMQNVLEALNQREVELVKHTFLMVDQQLSNNLLHHERKLASAVTSLEQSISINFEGIFESVSIKQQALDTALVGTRDQVSALETELLGFHNAFQYLEGTASNLALHLEALARQALTIHEHQTETQTGLVDLSLAIRSLSNTTNESLQSINDSALAVGYNVRRAMQENSPFGWKPGNVAVLLFRKLLDLNALDPLTCISFIVTYQFGLQKICRLFLMIAGFTVRSVFRCRIGPKGKGNNSSASLTRVQPTPDFESPLLNGSTYQALGPLHAPRDGLSLQLDASGYVSTARSTRCSCQSLPPVPSSNAALLPRFGNRSRSRFSRIPSRLWNPSGRES